MQSVLIVDNDTALLREIQESLEQAGYQVDTTSRAKDALTRLKQSRPDLLIVDAMMPEMDGFELMALVRRDPALSDLSIIVLTVRGSNSDMLLGYTPGSETYLLKPLAREMLLACVRDRMGWG